MLFGLPTSWAEVSLHILIPGLDAPALMGSLGQFAGAVYITASISQGMNSESP